MQACRPVFGFLNMLGGSYGIPVRANNTSYLHYTHILQVDILGKSIRLAGELGSENIPPDMKSAGSHGGPSFTVINNAQALKLASLQT